ncbi:interferon-inducible GTPase 5 isoform X1 [Cricetulus griseus]|uniref:interferon-inducible GTPase 5 isoform X1 n=1 Tax=Cricetulus griseus TaxID=10029 RepID=UPI0015C3A2C2|nr:interferon-inducible GTPase 5 isoform X1 [Cricetulus griseus]
MATSRLPAVPEEETTILMAKEELEALRSAFESGDIPQAASRLRELLATTESTRLEVGVTGESGAGKSSLINALRGLGAEDPGAALTGVVETTMQPSSYPHPQFPDVTLWDLPGAGSPGCSADKYLKEVDFGRYDFFLLVSPRRCGAVETRLASEILRQGKKFYFVRTKVDEDLAATRSQRPSAEQHPSSPPRITALRTHAFNTEVFLVVLVIQATAAWLSVVPGTRLKGWRAEEVTGSGACTKQVADKEGGTRELGSPKWGHLLPEDPQF